jgi:dihydrofolate reductase
MTTNRELMKISIIVAIGKNREMGKNGKIPWHISEDFKRFKQITLGHPVIMGRKTWESLPVKPLPNRFNIVITRDPEFKPAGAIVCNSIENAIKKAQEMLKQVQYDMKKEEIFIIGGGQVFGQAMPLVNKLYLTIIDRNFDADIFFPDYSDFKKVVFEKQSQEEDYKYKFLDLER